MSIVVEGLTKRYGSKVAIEDLSFEVLPGAVTGFLGPNGAGKSTTMRCMIGLDEPGAGRATFQGKAYASLPRPLHEVGVLLDAGYVHPGRSGRDHLRWMAAANGISEKQVDALLERVGLTTVARKRVGTYSLGMKQRLGLAGVLLGDPHTIILDEPANGLDPEGIRWIRDLLRDQASRGKAVLVSSHLMSEMALMASTLVVIGRGRLIEQTTVADFIRKHGGRCVRAASPGVAALAEALRRAGARVEPIDEATVTVYGMTTAEVGEAAHLANVVLHELSSVTGSLEEAFLRATSDAQEFKAGGR